MSDSDHDSAVRVERPDSVNGALWPCANDEMVEGFMDGYDLDCPEPSDNRSRSYRYGFANGRADKTGKSRGMTFDELIRAADTAMALDYADQNRVLD